MSKPSARSAHNPVASQSWVERLQRYAAGSRTVVATCKHLGLDPFAYLRDALPGVFALGEMPTSEQLLDRLTERCLLNRTRN